MNRFKTGLTVVGLTALAAISAQAQEVSSTVPGPITTLVSVASPEFWQSANTTHDINSGGTLAFGDTQWEIVIQHRAVGTSTVNINAGGTMAFAGADTRPYGDKLFIGNRNTNSVAQTTIGIINVAGGTLAGANLTEVVIGREGSDGTLNISGGTAILGAAPVFGTLYQGILGRGSINFTTNSTGSLTIAGADAAYYEGIYADGTLTRGGTTYKTFAENFTVVGSELTSIAGTIPALPPYWKADPVTGSAGRTDRAYIGTLAGKAADHNGDAITYSKTSGAPWLSVAGDGTLSGIPVGLGTNTFTVTATDVDGATDATLSIFVADPSFPVWSVDPVVGAPATTDTDHIGTLAGLATDADGDTITYSKTAGPAWLSVAGDGGLSGVPADPADLGLNLFTVLATDTNGSASASLHIMVYVPPPVVSVVSADFEGSTARAAFDTNNGTTTDWDGTVASAANLNAGTVGGTWSGLSSTTTANDGLLDVAYGAYMPDNQLIMGIHPHHNDNPGHLTTATLDFDAAVELDGLVVSMDAAMLGFGGQPGQTYIDLMSGATVVARISASHDAGEGRGSINHYSAIGDYGQNDTLLAPEGAIWGTTDADIPVVNIEMAFGASGYGLATTGAEVADINTIGLSYVNSATTVDAIRFSASFSKAAMAFDNIHVGLAGGPPIPVTDLAIAGPIDGGTAMEISWTGENRKTYRVETNSNLIIGDWQTFRGGLVGAGDWISVTNTIGANQIFYRVISE